MLAEKPLSCRTPKANISPTARVDSSLFPLPLNLARITKGLSNVPFLQNPFQIHQVSDVDQHGLKVKSLIQGEEVLLEMHLHNS